MTVPVRTVAVPPVGLILAPGWRWMAHWGATTEEIDAELPGDELMEGADLATTRAVTVYARAAEIWPWIAQIGPGRSLVLRGGIPLGRTAAPFDSTWSFVLREEPDGTTRLISRERYEYPRWWAPLVVEPASAVSFVMSRRMLHGIAERAEIAARAAQVAA